MTFETPSGYTAGQLNENGVLAFSGPLRSADLVDSFEDGQEPAHWGLLPGVLVASAITGSGLTLSFPDGYAYYARQVWVSVGISSVILSNMTLYLYGCSDGQVRTSATETPPAGWDDTSSCLLCLAVGSGGNLTITQAGVQQLARYANPATRVIQDGAITNDAGNSRIITQGFMPQMTNIPAGVTVDVPAGYQWRVYGPFSGAGIMTVEGSVLGEDVSVTTDEEEAQIPAGVVYANTSVPAGNTIANTTAATAFTPTYPVPENSLQIGPVLPLTAYGVYSTDAVTAGTLTFAVSFGSTQLCATAALTNLTSLSAQGWKLEALLIETAVGSGGSAEAQGLTFLTTAASTALVADMPNASAVTVNTTVPEVLELTVTWSAASASNTITLRQFVVSQGV